MSNAVSLYRQFLKETIASYDKLLTLTNANKSTTALRGQFTLGAIKGLQLAKEITEEEASALVEETLEEWAKLNLKHFPK